MKLSEDDRGHLREGLEEEAYPPHEAIRVRLLLKVDEGPGGPAWSDTHAADKLGIAPGTVGSVRKRFCARGLGCIKRLTPTRKRMLAEEDDDD